jgi:hypothetical protein
MSRPSASVSGYLQDTMGLKVIVHAAQKILWHIRKRKFGFAATACHLDV